MTKKEDSDRQALPGYTKFEIKATFTLSANLIKRLADLFHFSTRVMIKNSQQALTHKYYINLMIRRASNNANSLTALFGKK